MRRPSRYHTAPFTWTSAPPPTPSFVVRVPASHHVSWLLSEAIRGFGDTHEEGETRCTIVGLRRRTGGGASGAPVCYGEVLALDTDVGHSLVDGDSVVSVWR